MNFGSPSLLSNGTVDVTATLSISCSAMTSGTYVYCLSIDAGAGGVSGSNRTMTKTSGGTLAFNIYQDSARTIPWGSRTTPSLGTIPGISINGSTAPTGSRTIYGRIVGGQAGVAPGSYSSLFSGSNVQLYRLASSQTNCTSGTLEGKAATVSPSFTVSAAPIADCSVSAGALAFGAKGSLTANVDSTATISATCTGTTPYAIGLGNGLTGTSATDRRMTSGANSISYALYLDSARTNVWSTSATASGTGTGSSYTHIVYGRVPAQTTPAPSSYSDTVVVTLTY